MYLASVEPWESGAVSALELCVVHFAVAGVADGVSGVVAGIAVAAAFVGFVVVAVSLSVGAAAVQTVGMWMKLANAVVVVSNCNCVAAV